MNRHVASQTMSSREFNQNTSRAKALAKDAPLVITDRGQPAYVLMSQAEYEKLTQSLKSSQPEEPKRFVSLAEALEQKGGPEYDFEIDIAPRAGEPFRDPFENDRD